MWSFMYAIFVSLTGSTQLNKLNKYKHKINFYSIIHLNMASLTLTLSNSSSVLSVNIFPPIELDSNYEYECGLINFQAFHSIPNITESMNRICVGEKEIVIPTGTYEVDSLNDFIKKRLDKNTTFNLSSNKKTLHAELTSSLPIDFTKAKTIAPLLGFKSKKLPVNELHISDNPVDIFKIHTVRIECDIIKNSYFNNRKTNTIHEFYPQVDPGYKIVERPRNVIYFPIVRHTIDSITLSILDQNNQPIDFRGENITARIHIKRIGT